MISAAPAGSGLVHTTNNKVILADVEPGILMELIVPEAHRVLAIAGCHVVKRMTT